MFDRKPFLMEIYNIRGVPEVLCLFPSMRDQKIEKENRFRLIDWNALNHRRPVYLLPSNPLSQLITMLRVSFWACLWHQKTPWHAIPRAIRRSGYKEVIYSRILKIFFYRLIY